MKKQSLFKNETFLNAMYVLPIRQKESVRKMENFTIIIIKIVIKISVGMHTKG